MKGIIINIIETLKQSIIFDNKGNFPQSQNLLIKIKKELNKI